MRTSSPHVLARLRELQVVHELREELHHDPLLGKPVDALKGWARLSRPRVAEPADRVAHHADEDLTALFELQITGWPNLIMTLKICKSTGRGLRSLFFRCLAYSAWSDDNLAELAG